MTTDHKTDPGVEGGGGGGGDSQVQRGGSTRLAYFAEEGVFFKTSACPRFCKRRGPFFVPKYEVWGVKIPLRNIRGSDAEWLHEVTGLLGWASESADARQAEYYKI